LLQSELARKLTRNAGVTIAEEGCRIREIERFQRYFTVENISIMVYNFNTFGRSENPLFDGCALLISLEREIKYIRLNILGIQLCFRFPIDGFSGKWWSK